MTNDDINITEFHRRLNENVFEDDGPALTEEGVATLLANYQGLVAEYGEPLVRAKLNELNSITHAAIRATGSGQHKR